MLTAARKIQIDFSRDQIKSIVGPHTCIVLLRKVSLLVQNCENLRLGICLLRICLGHQFGNSRFFLAEGSGPGFSLSVRPLALIPPSF